MRTATLIVDKRCRCWKFRLVAAAGRVVWRNRVFPHAQGARRRMAAWAAQHGYRIVEGKGVMLQQKAG